MTKPRKRGRPAGLPKINRSEDSSRVAAQLANFTFLNIYRVTDHAEVKQYIKIIFQQMEAEGLVPKQSTYRSDLRANLRIVLLNLCVSYFSDPTKWVAYHRSTKPYRRGGHYHKLGLKYRYLVQKIVPFLISHKYIEHKRGFQFSDAKKISRMRATASLMEIAIKESKVALPMIQRDLGDNVLILRDIKRVIEKRTKVRGKLKIVKDKEKRGRIIQYLDTLEPLRMKTNLLVINERLRRTPILLYITDKKLALLNANLKSHPDSEKRKGGSIDFTQTQLHRVFNNFSWSQGGRFYGGWWQRVPREYRDKIRINGQYVVELDYSALHPSILYAWEKLEPPKEDLYWIDGYSNDPVFRKFVKTMLLMMVNSKSRKSTILALRDEVKEQGLAIPSEIPKVSAEYVYPLMDAFEEKHKPIKKYFNSGAGIDLQYWDSVIAEKIMLRFSGVALPVHDSFIVPWHLEEELWEIMDAAFREVFAANIKVDIKYRSMEEKAKTKGVNLPENEKKLSMIRLFRVIPPVLASDQLERWQGQYQTYYNLLNAYRNLHKEQLTSRDSNLTNK
ncbi:MAG: hypothetical protein CVU57_02455 [Deltaproteobacteria bacterium HGW-Deltaproteobacteria-15]|jgi:hypothetical protein|nr:MAG: hypothetical protein CVU57_02455 [Deltaproteobacteria bacterium HGW-Deltaproteobacteria-15]